MNIGVYLVTILTTALALPLDNEKQTDSQRQLEVLLKKLADRQKANQQSEEAASSYNQEIKDKILPSTKLYLKRLEKCFSLVQNLRLIERHFYYVADDKTGLEESQLTLCRLSMVLEGLYEENPDENRDVNLARYISDRSSSLTSPRKRVFDRINPGLIEIGG